MAVLSWGECLITHAISVDGYPASAWGGVDTPKEDTTKLTTTSGSEQLATREGGSAVDARYNRSNYQLEFDIVVQKGMPRPFSDEDGNIVGEHKVMFIGGEEILTISHSAQTRSVFARGAVAAAKYMLGKEPGMYDMQKMIGDD